MGELNKHHMQEEEKNVLKALTAQCDDECLSTLFKTYEKAEEAVKEEKAGDGKKRGDEEDAGAEKGGN